MENFFLFDTTVSSIDIDSSKKKEISSSEDESHEEGKEASTKTVKSSQLPSHQNAYKTEKQKPSESETAVSKVKVKKKKKKKTNRNNNNNNNEEEEDDDEKDDDVKKEEEDILSSWKEKVELLESELSQYKEKVFDLRKEKSEVGRVVDGLNARIMQLEEQVNELDLNLEDKDGTIKDLNDKVDKMEIENEYNKKEERKWKEIVLGLKEKLEDEEKKNKVVMRLLDDERKERERLGEENDLLKREINEKNQNFVKLKEEFISLEGSLKKEKEKLKTNNENKEEGDRKISQISSLDEKKQAREEEYLKYLEEKKRRERERETEREKYLREEEEKLLKRKKELEERQKKEKIRKKKKKFKKLEGVKKMKEAKKRIGDLNYYDVSQVSSFIRPSEIVSKCIKGLLVTLEKGDEKNVKSWTFCQKALKSRVLVKEIQTFRVDEYTNYPYIKTIVSEKNKKSAMRSSKAVKAFYLFLDAVYTRYKEKFRDSIENE